jgi:asparagine synthase (glutamine-hydrolysing)
VVWPELGFHPQLLEHKRLLSAAIAPSVRPLVVGRPKQGFTLPFARWIRRELAPIVREGMQQLAARSWLAPDAPDRVWTDWQAGRLHWTRPWSLAVLGHMIASPA